MLVLVVVLLDDLVKELVFDTLAVGVCVLVLDLVLLLVFVKELVFVTLAVGV